MELKNINNVYFIGIGGIGMSALARWFHINGCKVGGYDKVSTPITDALVELGIEVHFEEGLEYVEEDFKQKEDTLIVYTPAIPLWHKELTYFSENEFEIKKRAEVLGIITKDIDTIAVSGTHGKTTTSSLLAHILKVGELNCMAFLGGIPVNYNSNLICNESSENIVAVVEADEFDRSFLQLHPDSVIVTSIEADHLDIYNSHESLIDAFKQLVNKLPEGNRVVCSVDAYKNLSPNLKKLSVDRYAVNGNSVYTRNLFIKNGTYVFDYVGDRGIIEGIELSLPGLHNVENCLAAITVALDKGVTSEKIREAVKSFKGIERRFEYRINEPNLTFIDDYAHHPSEIDAVVHAARELYPDKKLAVVFQPHLFSRTRDFMKGFGRSLSKADQLYLLDIYPARELPITGVSSDALLKIVDLEEKVCISKNALVDLIAESDAEVFMTLGAGDIDKLVEPIEKTLLKRLEAEETHSA